MERRQRRSSRAYYTDRRPRAPSNAAESLADLDRQTQALVIDDTEEAGPGQWESRRYSRNDQNRSRHGSNVFHSRSDDRDPSVPRSVTGDSATQVSVVTQIPLHSTESEYMLTSPSFAAADQARGIGRTGLGSDEAPRYSYPVSHQLQETRLIRSDRYTQPSVSAPSVTSSGHSIPPPLSIKAKEFTQIRLEDFEACLRYVNKYPAVLDEAPRSYISEALTAVKNGETSRGKRIASRLAMIYHHKKHELTLREFLLYLNDLDNGKPKKTCQEYYKQYEKVWDQLLSEVRLSASSQPQLIQQPAAFPGLARYDSSIRDSQSVTQDYAPALPQVRDNYSVVGARVPRDDTEMKTSLDPGPTADGEPYYAHSSRQAHTSSNQPLSVYRYSERAMPHQDLTVSSYANSTNSNFMTGTNNPYAGSENRTHNLRPAPRTSTVYHDEGRESRDLDLLTLGPTRIPDFQPRNTVKGKIEGGIYEARKVDAKNFYRVGKVFRMWWHSPAGANAPPSHPNIYEFQGHRIHSKPQWMVVVINKQGYCICCPISTYRGRGVGKSGLNEREIRAHAIIHSHDRPAFTVPGEPQMDKDPIRVKSIDDRDKLDPAARVHFGQCHTVQWDAHVMEMGRVITEDREKLYSYFRAEYQRP